MRQPRRAVGRRRRPFGEAARGAFGAHFAHPLAAIPLGPDAFERWRVSLHKSQGSLPELLLADNSRACSGAGDGSEPPTLPSVLLSHAHTRAARQEGEAQPLLN